MTSVDSGLFNMREAADIDELMNDSRFMAYLAYPSSSLPIQNMIEPLEQPTATTSATMITTTKTKPSVVKKSSSIQTKIGRCEHPKHVIYRQEKYTLMPSTATADETSVMKTVPRRGRPPKGSKLSELDEFPVSPVNYPIVELTVRPLPKRLEKVVGKSNIKVCLTCLKRSDSDDDYINCELYIPPQQTHKKKS